MLLLRAITYYYFHTAIACVALYINCQILRGFAINWYWSALIFSTTLFIYNFNSFRIANSTVRKTILVSSITSSTLLACYTLNELVTNFTLFILISLSVVAYCIPIEKPHVRRIHFLKIFLIGIAWAFAANAPNNLSNQITQITFLYAFLLTFSLTIPFDMRDIEIDTFKTISKSIGTKYSSYLAMGIYAISSSIIYLLTFDIIAFIASLIFGFIVLYYSKKHFQNNYYLAFIELLIPIQTLIFSLTNV